MLTREWFVASAGLSPKVSVLQADSDRVLTVSRRKKTNTGALAMKPRIPMTGVTNTSSHYVIQKGVRRKSLFASGLSFDANTFDVSANSLHCSSGIRSGDPCSSEYLLMTYMMQLSTLNNLCFDEKL